MRLGFGVASARCPRVDSMNVAVMDVRVMRVAVGDGSMNVWLDVRFRSVPCERMLVPVMLIVSMGMNVIESLVTVLVGMVLGYMQPYTDAHQGRGGRQ